jgi:hypothetical protein
MQINDNEILLLGQIHFENENELKIYENYINSIKIFGYKILIVDSSSYKELFNYKLCDYYLYDKENRLFNRNLGEIYFYVQNHLINPNFKLHIHCKNNGSHELNILYQNTKSFNLAKTLGYKYILRMECDSILDLEDFTNIKNKMIGIFF